MRIILGNAFSLQMLDLQRASNVQVTPLTLDEVKSLLSEGFVSAVGHQDTANVLSDMLGLDVPCNRINIHLTPKDN
ncbi:STIV orfB116 family protein [Thermoanaerobacterium thermosaccharolyticum]|uniref:STIV orfB116 family protein n=1 Tax=Thermoanaerobacterium thermosaccharolyticum TaxID=1517 RepID=UPI003DA8ECCE